MFVADRLNITLETDDRLLEIAHGTWEGRLRDEIAADDPERFRAWKERPGDVGFESGETLGHVRSRWRHFASTFAADAPALVVTHDAVVRVAILEAQSRGLDDLWHVQVENAGFAEFDVSGDGWILVREHVNEHLAGLRAATQSQAL
jgi:probable phosphoglycerate mutase